MKRIVIMFIIITFGLQRGECAMADKKMLSPQEYEVTQLNATEPPFQNRYWNEKREGIYVDVVSGEPLFSSKDKFDSGTGWPSFTRPVDQYSIVERMDTSNGMSRIEVRSAQADSHLGHVFDDGPQQTGKRYCINSAALRFVPKDELVSEGYGKYAALFAATVKYPVATFGAGCFWGVEAAFREQKGIVSTSVGYMGGHTKDPTYEQVCSGQTGHAEVVQVTYDPEAISYEALLWLFWSIHDPTQLNRQGVDIGDNYRSIIFFHTPEQAKEALEMKKKLDSSGQFKKPVVTQIVPASDFYLAEDYHQDYVGKAQSKPSCSLPLRK